MGRSFSRGSVIALSIVVRLMSSVVLSSWVSVGVGCSSPPRLPLFPLCVPIAGAVLYACGLWAFLGHKGAFAGLCMPCVWYGKGALRAGLYRGL